jgi:hypothetical protein
MALRIARLLNLLLTGVLVGNEFGSWAAVHPALGTLPAAAQVRAEQAITRRYGRMMPFLMVAAIVSCLPVLTLARDRRSAAFRCPLAATFLSFPAAAPITGVAYPPGKGRWPCARQR